MIIVKLIGGLGNQMFQYALGKSLAIKNNCELKLDITGFETYKLHKYSLQHYNIKESFAAESEIIKYRIRSNRFLSRFVPFLTSNKYVREGQFGFRQDVLDLTGNVYLEGYWQTEKYFTEIEKIIRSEFQVKNPASGLDLDLIDQMKLANSVSLHVRRTDYVSNPSSNAMHGVCGLDYYKKAVDYISQNVDKPVFYVFSDDHEWASENIKTGFETVFVHHNNADKNYEDLRLMSSCKHNIIANSSYSWWGAWLNENRDKKIIAPRRWFADNLHNDSDMLPDSWHKIY